MVTAPPLVVIQGPTASGKTALGIALAQAQNGEIVSADSRQVYRLMDIGTAKPTAQERAAAPHHLIDLVYPDEDFALADYLTQARAVIDVVHARGRLPLLIGGTGQYITALLEGWTIPHVPPNDALRAELTHEAEQIGSAALHERLRERDPAAAAEIHPNNLRRVIRALEVIQETGKRFSDLRRKQPPPYHTIHISLTGARDALYARADCRFDQMMAEGLLDEVRGLLDAGYAHSLPSMSGLGYAELCAHLLDGETLPDAVQRAKFNTHNFIRRQLTWFRGHDQGVTWYDVGEVSQTLIVDDVAERLQRHR
jgi:tRNA dimethylallyltransferase